MAFKQFELDGIGTVTVYKRRGTRSIRLSVDQTGKVKISMPTWSPYTAGLNFAKTKADWLQTQLDKHRPVLLNDGGIIGKQHKLTFKSASVRTPRSRIGRNGTITVSHAASQTWQNAEVQAVARRAAIRALRVEAEELLPGRLVELARRHDFTYKSASVRLLKSRWGSCDQDQNITLNLYLMQLPWHLIDYVILHELTHTRVMQHGPVFWQAMQAVEPSVQMYRKEIRQYRTILLH